MRWIIIFTILCASEPVQAARQVWGVENWDCGTAVFVIAPKMPIKRIVGTVSAARLPKAKPEAAYVRQALLSVHVGYDKAIGSIIASPDGRTNHSLDDHLFGLVLKQTGNEVIHVPISVTLDQAIFHSRLRITIDTKTYDGFSTITDPVECLNSEAHLTLFSK